ncbi:ABC transporter ATP-binding protein [Streptomyces sp. NPDC050095]|uniref:ABC transporter ATP-binding protein n=1 Tax=unclassified Streptomyces TaxID=2593676 RepID=UPI00342A1876
MLALEAVGLTKSFGAVRALDAVELRVRAGTVHCVLGENGAGKSTLCRLIEGSLTADSGQLRLYGEEFAPRRPGDALAAGIAMVHQHFSLVPTLTVGENLRLLRLKDLADRVARVRDEYGLAVDADAVVGTLPVGVRQRVEIVKALVRDPRLLVLDEPTGVLGPAETDRLLETCRAIADAGSAVVLITHKLAEAARAGDEATVLRGGKVAGGGPLAALPPNKLVPLMIGRAATDLGAGVAGTLGLDAPAPRARTEDVRDDAPPALRLTGVTVRRPDGTLALDGVDLTVAPGEIVGVAGVEGNGQSELMAVLGGALTADAGRMELTSPTDGPYDLTRATPRERTRAGLGIVPEDRHHEGCIPQLPLTHNLFLPHLARFRRFGVLLDHKAMRRAAEEVLTEHGVRAAGPTAPMASLSGGNQQKVVLARELALDPLVCLAAAQPTRGLDVGAVDAVHTRIRQAAARGAGVLVVSSELPELLALCDRIVVAYGGHLLGPVAAADPDAHERVGALMLGADLAPVPLGEASR